MLPLDIALSTVMILPPRDIPARASRGVERVCADPLARILSDAGFTGNNLRTAWAIAMRESRGQSLDESSPWYTGALGIFQIQTSAHSGKPWWTRESMLDPRKQAQIVYRYMTNEGSNWQHWGIGPGGTTDTTLYGGWSATQVYEWITEPFQRYYASYPCKAGDNNE